jgi:phosphoribosylglycinamide formyltransferase-1
MKHSDRQQSLLQIDGSVFQMKPFYPRCVITASTGGSVANACLANPFFRSLIHSIVCDQACGAAASAHNHGLPVQILDERDPEAFSTRLQSYLLEHRIDYVFSFYTKFYSEQLRRTFSDRIINLHPSLLPAFKGNDAWEYIKPYGVRFTGSTVEFIHERMDEGKIILQAVCPWDANQAPDFTRHRIFIQQCKSLLQVARWLAERRIRTEGCRVSIDAVRFDSFEFSPALDYQEAIDFEAFASQGGAVEKRASTDNVTTAPAS